MGITEKLMNIQKELKAPKGQYNSFGKYSYRSTEDILEGVKPLLDKNKCVLTITDCLKEYADRFYIEATVKLTDCETLEKIEVSALAREEENKQGMDAAQVTGATSSYARKYALNGLFCIDDTKDADYNNKGDKENKGSKGTSKKNTTNSEQTDKTTKIYKCNKCKVEVTEQIARYSYNKFKKILCLNCQKEEK